MLVWCCWSTELMKVLRVIERCYVWPERLLSFDRSRCPVGCSIKGLRSSGWGISCWETPTKCACFLIRANLADYFRCFESPKLTLRHINCRSGNRPLQVVVSSYSRQISIADACRAQKLSSARGSGSALPGSMSAYGYRDGYAPRRHTDDRRPRDSEERHREHGDSRSRAPASSRLAGQLPGPPAAAPEPEAPAALPPPPALPPAPAVAGPKPAEKEPPLDRTKVQL